MGYPPPPPPPGQPGGYGPPSGPPGYGGPPPGSPPPPGGPGYGGPGYGGPPAGGPPPGGYGGPPGGYAPAPPPSSGSSKGPLIALMAAIVVVVLIAVVGGLVLLSRGGDKDVELTSDERLDALLTEGDLGGSFGEDPESDDDPSSDEDIEASGDCQDLLDRLDEEGANPFSEGDDPAGSVARSFTDESGATVEHGLAPSIDLVDTYGEVIDACDELTFEEDGATATVSFAEGTSYDLGDDSVTAEVHFSYTDGEDTIEFDSYVVVWTDRGTDGFLAFGPGVDDSFDPVDVDTAFVEDSAQTAADKLSEIIDEA